MIDFDKVKIIKQIGYGMYGTIYLVSYMNKKYALKLQHVIHSKGKKSFKNEMWRELDLYKYINKLNKEDSSFLTKLYGYKLYNKCTHKQERPFKFSDKELGKKIKKLDKSEWCIKYLMDYKGNLNLHKFLMHH
jgi:serine/threonine protein kinase